MLFLGEGADAVVVGVNDKEVALAIGGEASGAVEEVLFGGRGSEGGDNSFGAELADAVVKLVANKEEALFVEESRGVVKASLESGSIAQTLLGGTGECGDVALFVDFADAMVSRVSDVDVLLVVDGDS